MQRRQLEGTYRLVSWENRHASGRVTFPLGPDAVGMIHYTRDGHVFVHIMANNRTHHVAGDLFGGELEELKQSAISHISYSGTYCVDGSEVVHRVAICSFPNWVRSEQRRHWSFEDGNLLLSAKGLSLGDEKVDAYLIWRPVA